MSPVWSQLSEVSLQVQAAFLAAEGHVLAQFAIAASACSIYPRLEVSGRLLASTRLRHLKGDESEKGQEDKEARYQESNTAGLGWTQTQCSCRRVLHAARRHLWNLCRPNRLHLWNPVQRPRLRVESCRNDCWLDPHSWRPWERNTANLSAFPSVLC